MAILKKDTYKKQVIDLTGPDGNAFYLQGTAMNLCKQIGISSERTEEIISGSFDPPIVEDEFIDNVIGTVNP